MEQNESKTSLTHKQPQYSIEVINLGNNSHCQQNLSHTNNSNNNNISDPIFPFAITTATRPNFPNHSTFSLPTSSPGNNYDPTTDDAKGSNRSQGQSSSGAVVSNERRLKRMISNRESARRSRMRRKMQIEELQCLVSQLQTTNRQLSEKLIQLLDCNQQILQENSQLKEKISSLQMVLSDFLVPLRNVGEDHNSSGTGERALRAQGSSTVPSVTISSMQLLQ